jgi:hypothetical protein
VRTRFRVYVCFVLILFFAAALNAQDWGVLKRVDETVNVRAQRSTDSRIVFWLKPGDVVKADFLDGSWWSVCRIYEPVRSEENAMGFVYAPLLKPVSHKNMTVWSTQGEDLKE